jgi:hypothetical protein
MMQSDEIKADKQRLAVKLETNKRGGGAITDQIRPLSETMSKEKIAAIRIKRLAKKRATIKDDDIDRDADHSYLDDATHSIVKRERCHKTRTSVLQSSTKVCYVHFMCTVAQSTGLSNVELSKVSLHQKCLDVPLYYNYLMLLLAIVIILILIDIYKYI